jgi:hypothetical protein
LGTDENGYVFWQEARAKGTSAFGAESRWFEPSRTYHNEIRGLGAFPKPFIISYFLISNPNEKSTDSIFLTGLTLRQATLFYFTKALNLR